MSYSTFQSIYLKHKWVIYVDRGSQKTWLNVTSGIITFYNTVILVRSFIKFWNRNFLFIEKVQDFLWFNFVPSFSEGQNIIQYNYSMNQKTETTVSIRKLKLQWEPENWNYSENQKTETTVWTRKLKLQRESENWNHSENQKTG